MQNSIWQDGVSLPSFPTLSKDIKTDVLIIGGGMAGLLCARLLEKEGIPYVLVEGGRIASGVTKNTTAKITFQHGLIYQKILKNQGREKAKMYLEAGREALAEFKNLCADIPCDFAEKDAFTYSLKNRKQIEEEVQAVQALGFPASFSETPTLPIQTLGAIRFPSQAQFHPLKCIAGFSKSLHIYEHTFITGLDKNTAFFHSGKIRADKIIVTTHFPFLNTHGSYFLKLYQHRSYVAAFENAPDVQGMFVDESDTGLSFRNQSGLLLVGCGGHRTGKKSSAWREAEALSKSSFPKAALKYQWATQDCMSLDGIPYIGKYSKNTPDLYVATGFNKWGMTSSMVAAMILTDMIIGKKNECEEIYNPSRSMLHPQLAVNIFESAKGLLTPTTPRCPHMGCALKYNKQEHSWDCPCHGSRFEENGKLINNPATDDIKKLANE